MKRGENGRRTNRNSNGLMQFKEAKTYRVWIRKTLQKREEHRVRKFNLRPDNNCKKDQRSLHRLKREKETEVTKRGRQRQKTEIKEIKEGTNRQKERQLLLGSNLLKRV